MYQVYEDQRIKEIDSLCLLLVSISYQPPSNHHHSLYLPITITDKKQQQDSTTTRATLTPFIQHFRPIATIRPLFSPFPTAESVHRPRTKTNYAVFCQRQRRRPSHTLTPFHHAEDSPAKEAQHLQAEDQCTIHTKDPDELCPLAGIIYLADGNDDQQQ